jgi:hypothetical protein
MLNDATKKKIFLKTNWKKMSQPGLTRLTHHPQYDIEIKIISKEEPSNRS